MFQLSFLTVFLSVPCILLFLGILPENIANRSGKLLIKLYKALLWLLLLTYTLALFPYIRELRSSPLELFSIPIGKEFQFSISYFYTDMSVYLGILISFLGLVALQYSERYLAGERRQGYFYKWMAVSIGSILSFVSSDNLIVFAISWSLSSWGLHSLLTFYPEKAAGTLSAWKKFYISRLGDLFLGIATILCYMEFKTLQLDRIFSIIQSGNFTREYTELIGLFLALGALTKSAQLPFHTWLPDTMESPTPVSALMHAGIINAGGVLLIKLSPLMNLSAMGLNLLVIFGGITAFVASIIMLTETSIKKSLAYSTISQMGLMILQCGLGAYSLAMVHIIGHSFYKAYSFLSANSILQKEYYKNPLPGIWEKLSFSHIGVSVFLSIGIYFLVKIILGIDILEKKGLLVLAPTFIMSLIFFFKLRLSFLEFSLKNLFYSIFAMILFTGLYTMLCLFFETVAPVVGIKSAGVSNEIQMFILILLSLVFLLQLTVKFWSQTGFGRSFYIHTRNGFYMDIVFSKLIKPFVPDVKLEKR